MSTGPPPPPPPPPAPGGPPPPPPPFFGSGVDPPLAHINTPKPRSKMKTLQWQKIPANNVVGKANIWTIIGHLNNKYEVDYQQIEELFSLNHDNHSKRGAADGDDVTDGKKKKENAEITILDGKRSLNVNIFLKQFKMEHQEIVQLIREGRCEKFGAERLRSLLKQLPSQEEVDAINSFTGDREKLGNAEKFFICLMKLPNYRMRIEGLLMMEEFNVHMEWIRPAIEAVIHAAKDLQENQSLKELILLILNTGNYLNSGNYAGNAAGFKLSSLLKLTEIRANKPGITLMHYVAQEAEIKNPKLLKFPDEMTFLKDASQVSIETLTTDISNIASKVRAIAEQMVMAGKDFQQQMSFFLKEALGEVLDLEEDLKDIEQIRRELAEFFCEEQKSFKLEECFKIMQTFCERMRKAMEENIRRRIQEAKAESRRKSRDMENKRNSRDIMELLEQSMDSTDGSPVDLLADVRNAFVSRKFSHGSFSAAKVTKVNLGSADNIHTLGHMLDGSPSAKSGSMGSPFSSSDSLAQTRNRRSYATSDDESLLNFLMSSAGSREVEKPEARFERYSSIRRRRLERTGRKTAWETVEMNRERASSPHLLDINSSLSPNSSSTNGVIRRQPSSVSRDRPKSEIFTDEKEGHQKLRRSQSFLENPMAGADQRKSFREGDEESDVVKRVKERLSRKSGRDTPTIKEEADHKHTPTGVKNISRWRSNIEVSEVISPSESSYQNHKPDSATEKDSNARFDVSIRKKISDFMGTSIDGVLRTIEDSGRQIDVVGVTGPMQRIQEPSEKTTLSQPPVAVVAHVSTANPPRVPVTEKNVKSSKNSKLDLSQPADKSKPLRIMSDSRKDIKKGSAANVNLNRSRTSSLIRRSSSKPKTPQPPQVRLCKSRMKSDSEVASNSAESKTASHLTVKKKTRAIKSEGSNANDGDTARESGLNSSEKSPAEPVDVNNVSAPGLQNAKPVVKRSSANRNSSDGRRNGVYILEGDADFSQDNDVFGIVGSYKQNLGEFSNETATVTSPTFSLTKNAASGEISNDDDFTDQLASISNWKTRRVQQRKSTSDILGGGSGQDAGSRYSYASSTDKDEGFETASGTLSQHTSMNSILESDSNTLSRFSDGPENKSLPNHITGIKGAVSADNVFSSDNPDSQVKLDIPDKSKSTQKLSSTSSNSTNQKSAGKTAITSSSAAKPTKSVPSYMLPTNSSASRPPPNKNTPSPASNSPFKRNTSTRATTKDSTRGTQPDFARASMRAESSGDSFQRGTIARTSVRGPRTSLHRQSLSSMKSLLSPPSPRDSISGSNSDISSVTNSTPNISSLSLSSVTDSTKRRLSSISSTSTVIRRPTTPSANLSSPSGRTTPLLRPTTPGPQTSSTTRPSNSQTKAPLSASSPSSSGFNRTSSVRASTGRSSIGSDKRSTTPLPHTTSRSTTPLPERPHSTTPMLSESNKSRRSSFMAPTASSRARLEESSNEPPTRTQSLISISGTNAATRPASLRMPSKTNLTKSSGRKSPANVDSPLLNNKPEHYQSLSTVTEQVADEEKEDQSLKKSPSFIKKIISRARGPTANAKASAKAAGVKK